MSWIGVATPLQDALKLDKYEEEVLRDASLDVEDLGLKYHSLP